MSDNIVLIKDMSYIYKALSIGITSIEVHAQTALVEYLCGTCLRVVPTQMRLLHSIEYDVNNVRLV